MITIDPNLIYLGLAVASALGGGAGYIFRRGKQEATEESCIKRIESKVESMEKLLKKEIEDTTESHRIMHQRIDNLGTDVAYIKGKVDNHIDEKKD